MSDSVRQEDRRGAPLRVVFVHGLESGPHGAKARALSQFGFDVSAVDMEMSLLKLSKRNSVANQFLRQPMLYVGVVATCLCFTRSIEWGAFAAFLTFGLLVVVGVPAAWRRSLHACVTLQRKLIEEVDPDVVVGSSWGGAVVCELMRNREWTGPVVLLAPAQEKARAWMRRDRHRYYSPLKQFDSAIIVFHDPEDDVVDVRDSDLLVGVLECVYRRESGGGHRLLDVTNDGRLTAAVVQVSET